VSDAFAKKYGGSYINLNAMDSKNGDGDAYRSKYASKYLPADVKNWSDQQEVRDVFTKKYAGSSVNLNAMDSKNGGGDAYRTKYAGQYLPADVKNWSDQQEVRDVFTKKYAGPSVSLNAVSSEQDAGSHDAGADTNLDAVKSDNSFNGASVQLSGSRSNASPPSASVPPLSLAASNRLAETDAAIVTASREAVDTNAAIELASISEQGKQTAPHASLVIAAIAATLIVFRIFIVPSARKSRQHPVLDPLLD